MLQRRQVIIDDQTWLELVSWARDEGKSASKVAREWLAQKLTEKKNKKVKRKINTAQIFLDMAKNAEKLDLKGPRDLSTNDESIYR